MRVHKTNAITIEASYEEYNSLMDYEKVLHGGAILFTSGHFVGEEMHPEEIEEAGEAYMKVRDILIDLEEKGEEVSDVFIIY